MIIKPSIQWLNIDNDPLLVNNTKVILLALANNIAIYATPTPSLTVIQTALDNFSDGLVAAADGGRSVMSKKDNLRLILVGLMRQLGSYVAGACRGDMTNLLLSGFPVQKPVRAPIGPLPAPLNLIVTHGAISGELDAKINPVFGASTYNWTCKAATAGAEPQTGQSTASSYAFSGLTPGVFYTITANAVGAAGPSNWSSPVSMFAD